MSRFAHLMHWGLMYYRFQPIHNIWSKKFEETQTDNSITGEKYLCQRLNNTRQNTQLNWFQFQLINLQNRIRLFIYLFRADQIKKCFNYFLISDYLSISDYLTVNPNIVVLQYFSKATFPHPLVYIRNHSLRIWENEAHLVGNNFPLSSKRAR